MMLKNTILFVDDEISILNTIKRSFFRVPITILTASSAEDAYEILKKERVDLIISDYRMPVEDGVHFLRNVKTLYPGILRLLISGDIDKDQFMITLYSFNVVSLFPKPWDNKLLLDRILKLLSLKNSVEDKEIWKRINNPVFFKVDQELFHKKNLLEYIQCDILVFSGLLHLFNSEYYNGGQQLDLKNIINHFSEESIIEIINIIPAINQKTLQYPSFLHHSDTINKLYPMLTNKYQILTHIGKELSPAFINLFKYIIYICYLNINVSFLEKGEQGNFKFNNTVGKNFEYLTIFLSLWNIADPLYNFSEKVKDAIENDGFSSLSRGEKLLFITDYFIELHKDLSYEAIYENMISSGFSEFL